MSVFFLALGPIRDGWPVRPMLRRTPWRILDSARGETGEAITVGAQRELFERSPGAGRSHRAFCRARPTTTPRRRVGSPSLRGPSARRTDDQAPRSGDPGLVVRLRIREPRTATAPSPGTRQPVRLPHRLAAAHGFGRGGRRLVPARQREHPGSTPPARRPPRELCRPSTPQQPLWQSNRSLRWLPPGSQVFFWLVWATHGIRG
jgi:hypothetical protein